MTERACRGGDRQKTRSTNGPRASALALLLMGLGACAPTLPQAVQVSPRGASPLVEVKAYLAPEDAEGPAVVLIPTLGVSSEIFSVPGGGALAQALWGAGYSVYVLHIRWDQAESFPAVAEAVGATWLALTGERAHPRWFAVAHGWGGTALYNVLTPTLPLDGLVGLGAPLAWGGSSRGLQGVLQAPELHGVPEVTWGYMQSHPVVASSALSSSTERMLLSTGLPPELNVALYEKLQVPMRAELLQSVAPLAAAPVPVPEQALNNLRQRPLLPVLLIMGQVDGVAPPHQCDPVPLALERPNITRVYLTRVNGTDIEYNHLDLVLHPEAWSDVSGAILRWLSEQ